MLRLTEFILPPPHPSVKESDPRRADSYDQIPGNPIWFSGKPNRISEASGQNTSQLFGYPVLLFWYQDFSGAALERVVKIHDTPGPNICEYIYILSAPSRFPIPGMFSRKPQSHSRILMFAGK